jgi:hypothetical protein
MFFQHTLCFQNIRSKFREAAEGVTLEALARKKPVIVWENPLMAGAPLGPAEPVPRVLRPSRASPRRSQASHDPPICGLGHPGFLGGGGSVGRHGGGQHPASAQTGGGLPRRLPHGQHEAVKGLHGRPLPP